MPRDYLHGHIWSKIVVPNYIHLPAKCCRPWKNSRFYSIFVNNKEEHGFKSMEFQEFI